MKVIFVNWTKPFFERKNFMGYKKHSTYEYDGDDYFIPQHEIIMQIASITSAKTKTNFPLKLITDNIGKKYYEKIGMIDLFDEVDTETLESINNEFNINPAQFWTSGKIISICNEKPPFIFMDLDLILKDELPNWILNYDVVHTHWELSRSFLYIEKYMLDNLGLNIPTFNDRMLVPNTSFLFINNETLLSDYLKLHLEITTRTYELVPDWLWLMSDQHILGYSFRDLNLKVTSFSDMTYVQFPDTEKDKPGFLPEWIKIEQKFKETPINFEHVWLDKSKLINNPDYKTKKVSEWKSIINKNGYENKLLNIPDIYI
jgi:hypothetical protein